METKEKREKSVVSGAKLTKREKEKAEYVWTLQYNYYFDRFVEEKLKETGLDNWLKLEYVDIAVGEKNARMKADYDKEHGAKAYENKEKDFFEQLVEHKGDFKKIDPVLLDWLVFGEKI